MIMSLRVLLIIVGMLSAAIADAQQMSDPRIGDLVAAGKVRFGTFPPQYAKDSEFPWAECYGKLSSRGTSTT
jgi:hypothetical protein